MSNSSIEPTQTAEPPSLLSRFSSFIPSFLKPQTKTVEQSNKPVTAPVPAPAKETVIGGKKRMSKSKRAMKKGGKKSKKSKKSIKSKK